LFIPVVTSTNARPQSSKLFDPGQDGLVCASFEHIVERAQSGKVGLSTLERLKDQMICEPRVLG
jgi:hypothetical protein